MGTKTWLYGGINTNWTENTNWLEGSPPENGEGIRFTGSVPPSAGSTSTLTVPLFDSTELTSGLAGGTGPPLFLPGVTNNIVISPGGILLMGNLNVTGSHVWRGDDSQASTIILTGSPTYQATGNIQGSNAILTNFYLFFGTVGTGCRFKGNSLISVASTVGANAQFHDTTSIIGGGIGAGASFHGYHSVTCSGGSIVFNAGHISIHGDVAFVQTGANSITFNPTCHLYLVGLNSRATFAGTQATWPVPRLVRRSGSFLSGALP